MTLSVPVRKPERRTALEAPHRREHEQSQQRAMERGVIPRTLEALIAWLMEADATELPTELHKHEVWRDYGQHAEGGSHLGSPAYADGFRRLIEGSPSAIDESGYYLTPLRAALSRLRRKGGSGLVAAQHLTELLRREGDWQGWALTSQYPEIVARVWLREALRWLWVEHAEHVVRLT